MSYEIAIAFSKNHEMTWPCDGKTIEEVQELVERIRTRYPEAKVTIGSRENIFD